MDAYRWMGELWQQALVVLGAVKARALPVEEARQQPTLAHDDPLRLACYGTLSPWEVVAGKRKLVGLCAGAPPSGRPLSGGYLPSL